MYEDKELNQNQEQFCVGYTTVGREMFGNGTKSYMAAYPDCKDEASASASSARLLRNVKIQARINELHKENLTRSGVTVESVLANIQHDRMKAREAGLWSVACQLDKLEGQYLAMFTDNINTQPENKPKLMTKEEEAILHEAAIKLTKLNSGRTETDQSEAPEERRRKMLEINAG